MTLGHISMHFGLGGQEEIRFFFSQSKNQRQLWFTAPDPLPAALEGAFAALPEELYLHAACFLL
jgi:hypothetical protein